MAVIAIDFRYPQILFFIGSTSFDKVVDVFADVACVSRLTLLKKKYRDSGGFVFHGVLQDKDSAVCLKFVSFSKKIVLNDNFFTLLK